ncbi:DNA/RNA helicase domain-containing protein [Streptomonospora arabica]|uniref:DNA/RNA helicase domain-containing protein n=1 Tax=Streptomonospora arabica TaxID=412417 RepID=A0ABV9ST49_9ACTN
MLDFIPLLRDADVFCMINMHNADRAVLNAITPSAQQLSEVGEMRPFTRMYGCREEHFFERALGEILTADNADAHARELLDAPVAPTEPLMSAVSAGVRSRSVFTLLDEQREDYDYVKSRVTKSKKGDRKEVVLIVGGPGTGKSVIALELLDWLSRSRHRAVHATGSRAFTSPCGTRRTTTAAGLGRSISTSTTSPGPPPMISTL